MATHRQAIIAREICPNLKDVSKSQTLSLSLSLSLLVGFHWAPSIAQEKTSSKSLQKKVLVYRYNEHTNDMFPFAASSIAQEKHCQNRFRKRRWLIGIMSIRMTLFLLQLLCIRSPIPSQNGHSIPQIVLNTFRPSIWTASTPVRLQRIASFPRISTVLLLPGRFTTGLPDATYLPHSAIISHGGAIRNSTIHCVFVD